jgi:hypothetical protein
MTRRRVGEGGVGVLRDVCERYYICGLVRRERVPPQEVWIYEGSTALATYCV